MPDQITRTEFVAAINDLRNEIKENNELRRELVDVVSELSTRIGEGDRSRVGQDITSELSALADRIDAHERGVDEPNFANDHLSKLNSMAYNRDLTDHEKMSIKRHEEMLELIRVNTNEHRDTRALMRLLTIPVKQGGEAKPTPDSEADTRA